MLNFYLYFFSCGNLANSFNTQWIINGILKTFLTDTLHD